tara:strand:- start:149 stop:739 length:591 start_codon:yes stop_codon:yes gene_type:complete
MGTSGKKGQTCENVCLLFSLCISKNALQDFPKLPEIPDAQSSMVESSRQLKLFQKFLIKKNLRLTSQRRAILEAVYNQDDHYTAEELLNHARGIDDSVSRATIYRTLPILLECDIVREIDIGKDFKFYASNKREDNFQAQVVCLDCDKIFEIDAPFMDWYAKTAADRLSLYVESQRIQVNARCKRLQEGELCEHKC